MEMVAYKMVIRIFSSATISKSNKAIYSLLFLVDNKTLEIPNQSLYLKGSDIDYYICLHILLNSLKTIKKVLLKIDEHKEVLFYCKNSLVVYEWNNRENNTFNDTKTWDEIVSILGETNSVLRIIDDSVLEGVGEVF